MSSSFTRHILRHLSAPVVAFGLLLSAPLTQAAEFPEQPIKLVTAFGAGTGTDTAARNVAATLKELAGQPVIVENKPGANATIATQYVASSVPNGYTLLVTTSTHAANPSLFKQLKYDSVKDFEPVSLLNKAGMVLVVNRDSGYASLNELVQKLKQKQGQTSFAGANAATQITGEYFNRKLDTGSLYVAYKSIPQALTDLMGGQIDFMFSDITTAMPHIKAGKIRALAVTTEKRHHFMPEVPTLGESVLPGFNLTSWVAVFAPAGTPQDAIIKLNRWINQSQDSKAATDLRAMSGSLKATGSPEDLRVFLNSEIQKWADLVKTAGIAPQ